MDSFFRCELNDMMTVVTKIQSTIRMPLKTKNLLVEGFRSGTVDALTSILLSHFSNLKLLHLAGNSTNETTLRAIALKTLLCAPTGIRNEAQSSGIRLSSFDMLEEVVFTSHIYNKEQVNVNGDENWVKDRRKALFAVFLPFLYAPRIQKIHATIEDPQVSFNWLSWDERDCTPSSEIPLTIARTLKNLDVTLLREENLGKLLAQCPKLEILKWKFHGYPDHHSSAPCLGCRALEESLFHIKETLTSLDLQRFFEESNESYLFSTDLLLAHGMLSTLTNLHCFPLLARLETPWALLLGESPSQNKKLNGVLPAGLQGLVLRDDLFSGPTHPFDDVIGWQTDAKLFVRLEEWLENCKESLPQLQKLVLMFRRVDGHWASNIRFRFRGFEKRFKIKVEIIEAERIKDRMSTCIRADGGNWWKAPVAEDRISICE